MFTSHALEYEFVAGPRAARGCELPQFETSVSEKPKNGLGARDFKRVAAQPVDHVEPQAHASLDFAFAAEPSVDRSQPNKVGDVDQHDGSARDCVVVVKPLDPGPPFAEEALVVVHGDEQASTNFDPPAQIVHRSPLLAGVVHDPPAVDDVEKPKRFEIFRVKYRAVFDIPQCVTEILWVVSGQTLAQFLRAGHRLWIEVEGVHLGPQVPSRETEKPATRPGIQEAHSVQ